MNKSMDHRVHKVFRLSFYHKAPSKLHLTHLLHIQAETVFFRHLLVGEKVKKNQVILILEAMKMQHEITASIDGEVSDIYTNIGDQVSVDEDLLNINKEGEK